MKLISLIGARPQIIKEAIINKEFEKKGIKEILVHSGQHYDFNMSDVFFQVLNIRKADYNLGVGSATHAQMTAKTMIEFEKVVLKEHPDIILVYGDTNTTLAGAIVGAKLKIPVAHVEAGIRQEPKDMPEEINRVLTDRISKYLFCPSEVAVNNLKKESITEGVHFTGDIMYDLFLKMRPYFKEDIIDELSLEENKYIVTTIHRDFNTDSKEKLENILKELDKISKEIKVVFPIHPRTKKKIDEFNLNKYTKDILLIEPLDYLSMMGLVQKSLLVITDSGGLQKEAYFARKRAIVVMPDTGWRELTQADWNILSEPDEIKNKMDYIMNNEISSNVENIYGDGKPGEKIVKLLSI
ncbi:UDP-N-acetylglucosamine 2-epimerase [Petrotoga mobilis SJ95]|uniref:UDP-N-acetylglucosamine 2-epimerase n=1 Tax=Petrotoga mobilis (strain DSM 10674 / SJ95) TaxID=403833 RepID=A9BJR3_PETMO|nr:UDP-N-acetylglucosamine 2-epimerase (non-hydrolyzing) [Petrotoga mobilis]ABX31656.1 UDP-N-acetylglucosamine 2-epimerase [Petrotoga mobilis SJ95]